MPSKTLDPRLVAGIAFAVGAAIRYLALDYHTLDWGEFLERWYEHARLHGLNALRDEFTNYAPFYTYLVIAAAAFDGWASPLTLIKCISVPFEFGCALVGARLAYLVEPSRERAALAFAALWLSPSILHNGPFWGQCDAIWTFFILLAIWAASVDRARWAVLAFGFAVSVKLQAVFFAPFLLGYLIKRRQNVAWFALVPLVYVAIALPVLLAGRPLEQVLTIYLGQAEYYPRLWKGAANLYNLISEDLYYPGVQIGLAVAAIGGLVLARSIARAQVLTREGLVLAAAMSLAVMPFLLPKMHDRFYFGFDAVIIILACLRPLYVPVALAALTNSMICYLPFDGRGDFAQPVTGLQSLIIILYLWKQMVRSFAGQPVALDDPERAKMDFLRPSAALWFSYLAYQALKSAIAGWFTPAKLWPDVPAEPIGLMMFLSCLVIAIFMLRRVNPGVTVPLTPTSSSGFRRV